MRQITISDNGVVNVPNVIQMRDFEIAELLGVMVPTVKEKIKTLLKSRHFYDCTYSVVSDNSLIPEYFGLEMVIAIAFYINSHKADIFRKWIMRKMMQSNIQPIYIGVNELKVKDNFYN